MKSIVIELQLCENDEVLFSRCHVFHAPHLSTNSFEHCKLKNIKNSRPDKIFEISEEFPSNILRNMYNTIIF